MDNGDKQVIYFPKDWHEYLHLRQKCRSPWPFLFFDIKWQKYLTWPIQENKCFSKAANWCNWYNSFEERKSVVYCLYLILIGFLLWNIFKNRQFTITDSVIWAFSQVFRWIQNVWKWSRSKHGYVHLHLFASKSVMSAEKNWWRFASFIDKFLFIFLSAYDFFLQQLKKQTWKIDVYWCKLNWIELKMDI